MLSISSENLYYEPRRTLVGELSNPNLIEMSDFESAFLCGLLREKMPRKILEVGVAAGGTTAIIKKCVEELDLADKTELWSCDLSEQYYKDTSRKTGFLAEEVSFSNSTLLLGGVLPEFLPEIGGGIEFAVLDTVHITPGEVLDFIALLPYIDDGAYVVLHDIGASVYWGDNTTYATQQLLSTVTAEMIFLEDSSLNLNYPNIGAFVVNEDTRKYIFNLFFSLSMPWHYWPTDEELLKYRNLYSKHYDESCIRMFDLSVGANKKKANWLQSATRKIKLGEPIELVMNSGNEKWFKSGLYPIESDYAWTEGHEAKALFCFDDEILCDIECQIVLKSILGGYQSVVIRSDDITLFEEELTNEKLVISFVIPQRCIKERKLEVTIELPNAKSPVDIGLNNDVRVLALALQKICFFF